MSHLGTFKVPYIALIDGITMGGGVGLSVHGDYRVCTERTVFAMPETAIGLIPDVGGGHFLPRMKGEMGMFFALTGHRIKGLDCLHAGIATHACPSDQLERLKDDLTAAKDSAKIGEILDSYSAKFPPSPFSLAEKVSIIDKCFSKGSVKEVIEALEADAGKWGAKLAKSMRKMSPTSMKVTYRFVLLLSQIPISLLNHSVILRQIREGGSLSLAEVLKMEYRLVRRCCEDSDFYEGVRAVLIDRDNAPKWNPATLEQVDKDILDRYFSKLPESEELQL
jgi:3-hydroxyisobutyryl-CoA hydrolase